MKAASPSSNRTGGAGVPGMKESSVTQQLANLKASGDFFVRFIGLLI